MRKIRVLIVDDSTVVRRLLTDVLTSDPQIEVVGTASNGRLALAKLPQLNPDIVTLDIEMPELDGLGTIRGLRKTYPRLPVVMFSTLTERGAIATLDALSLGANDYVTKPANVGSVTAGIQAVSQSLIPKIKMLCPGISSGARTVANAAPPITGRPSFPAALQRSSTARIDIIVIGSSTGGPNALGEILPRLPSDLAVPIVIVQHMPPVFTAHLAKRLDDSSQLKIREGYDQAVVAPGEVWIAPGDFHLEVHRLRNNITLRAHRGPQVNSCRPAVDVLFQSAASTFGPNVLGVVLTGMGCDGLRGCESIRASGGRVFVQDEASSVVWGMPGSVAKAGWADRVIPLAEIGEQIMQEVYKSRTRTLATVN